MQEQKSWRVWGWLIKIKPTSHLKTVVPRDIERELIMSEYFVTVDMGGTKILAAVADAEGNIIARCKEKTERRDKDKLIAQLGNCIENALKSAEQDKAVQRADIAGIAMGVPGIVETSTGFVVETPNVPLNKTPLGELMSARFGVPSIVGNDANLGIVGETWRGAARGAESSFGIFVGTGIGGGLVLNGQLIEGYRGLGGEIGHFMLPQDADVESGITGKKYLILEELCSRTSIENQLRAAIKGGQKSVLTDIVGDKKLARIRSGALKEALKQEDALVTDVIKRASYALGLATASVLHTVDPETVVFGGGVVEACGKWMLPMIEKTALRVVMAGTGKPVKIVQSELGDDAILQGGIALLREHITSSGAQSAKAGR